MGKNMEESMKGFFLMLAEDYLEEMTKGLKKNFFDQQNARTIIKRKDP